MKKMETSNKSKLDFSKDPNYYNKKYNCELCGTEYFFEDMSTCDRCGRFICSKCSEAVVNREINPFKYDFLCNSCIKELEELSETK